MRVQMANEYTIRLAKLAEELAELGHLVAAAHVQAAADSLALN